jgi:hypothetical protein
MAWLLDTSEFIEENGGGAGVRLRSRPNKNGDPRAVHCENKPKAVSLNEFFSNEYASRARILQNEPNFLL